MYADAFKTVRSFSQCTPEKCAPWGSVNEVPVDSDGWPLTDFASLVFIDQPLDMVRGTYKLTFTGKAVLKTIACNCEIRNQVYDEAKNTTQADVIANGGMLALSFTATNGGIRDAKLIRPNHTNTDLFFRPALERLKDFSVIRFMDLGRTNQSEVKTWSDRAKPTDANLHAVPHEHMIELVNLLGKDMWVNLPALADDDYLAQLATLIKTRLNPNSKVYVEYSNEHWNSIFKALNQTKAIADAELAAGNKDLFLGGTDTNGWYAAWRVGIRQSIKFGDLLKPTMGDRVRVVLAHQVGNTETFKQALKYVEWKYGSKDLVKQKVYGIAAAPYFSCNKSWLDLTDLKREELIGCLASSVEGQVAKWKDQTWSGTGTVTFGQLANYYGLKKLGYEMGHHVNGAQSLAVKTEVNASPEMAELFIRYYTLWFACGGELGNQFSFSSGSGVHGHWGLYSDLTKESEKAKGLKTVANRPWADLKQVQCVAGTPIFPVPSPRPTPTPSTVIQSLASTFGSIKARFMETAEVEEEFVYIPQIPPTPSPSPSQSKEPLGANIKRTGNP